LTFADKHEFADNLLRLTQDRARAAAIAERGRQYVLDEYSWEAVLDRMEAALKEMP
jgi:glycosyltransferase involved in cell wall biosynthesis